MSLNQIRTSGRKRKVSQKLAESDLVNHFQGLDSSPEPPRPREDDLNESDNAGSDFQAAEGEDDSVESSIAASPGEAESSGSSESENEVEEAEDDLSDIIDVDETQGSRVAPSQRRRSEPIGPARESRTGIVTRPVTEPHQVGIYTPVKHMLRDKVFCYVNGDDSEAETLLLCMDRWLDDLTLPSPSRSLEINDFRNADSIVSRAGDSQRIEDLEGCAWYHRQETVAAFRSFQQHLEVGTKTLGAYLAIPSTAAFVIGGSNQTIPSTIEVDQVRNLQEVWSVGMSQTSEHNPNSMRRGWLLNAGQSVQCLKWVPNSDGPVQYLGIASRPERSLGILSFDRAADDIASAFVPGKPSPSIIEIWQLTCCPSDSESGESLDETPPRRHIVMCFDYGPIKTFDWCPVALNQPSEVDGKQGELGLLATVHDDGILRVFKLPFSGGKVTKNARSVRILKAAFEARPPNTVHTCFAWLSSSLIAAGCGNGFVAVYDLDQHFSKAMSHSMASPMLYEAFHETYITSVICCRPSRPHLLVSTAIDGRWRLTDLRDPVSEYAFSRRERTPPDSAAWHEQTQSILTSGESGYVRSAFARDVHTQQYIAAVSAHVRDIGVSSLHSSTLVGCADGAVYVMNPVGAALKGREKADGPIYKQAWFRHDWRRGQARPSVTTPDVPQPTRLDAAVMETAGVSTSGGQDQDDRRPSRETLDFPRGLARLTSGFRLENARGTRRFDNSENRKRDGLTATATTTIYEKETAVNTVAWNPNACAGGWAAAGMGDGLVMIEDLGCD